MVFQNPENQFVGSTVSDDVAFGLKNPAILRDKMIVKVKEVLQAVGMEDFYDSQPINLSGGQKQCVALASVLALEPDIIILDEATSMLDPLACQELITLVRKIQINYKLTVIAITHDINETLFSDNIFVINNGTLVDDGTPKTIYTDDNALASYGLETPLRRQLQQLLQRKNILPFNKHYLKEEELVEQLCQLKLNS